ncbi:Predicted dehydrogenase [Pelagirhabdus alkalitolerans]|uniref:Predicted dehydrogenase n=1 Tax=Pelagirhabdus alkalitolerans TaxID=1612202 RepID=A0A1G6GLA5_9BACI|nr:Gfo/Idh/MocA family oxidoreductase [Pelagirhabdus alkalitolerans]SDB82740.1 Predicted dehydrogenase [Pelagirhabdus alkalitolerans]
MSKLKAAIIGCGSISKHRHLPEYAGNSEVEIVALCDRVMSRAEAMQGVYGGRVYTDYEELLSNEAVDLVSVCLPNYLHAPVSIAALNSGAHVLCEKPMATTTEEAEAMIEAAEKNGKQLMIAHNQRFVRSHQQAKELIEQGAIGKVYSFKTIFGHGGPEGWSVDGKDSWFFKKDEAVLGAMGDLGVHKADLLRYVLGEEFTHVSAMVETNAKEAITVDDNAICLLKTESGVIGTLTASWAYRANEDNSTIIYGEKGELRLEDDPTYSLMAAYTDGSRVNYELGKIQSNEEGKQTSTGVIDHFVEAVRTNTKPLIDGEEGKKSLNMILAAIESSEKGHTIQL